MKKFYQRSNLGQEMYQDPSEAERHLCLQGKDFARYAKDLLDILPVRHGRLLDVGCGFGWVVAEAKRRGFIATGIDQAKPYVALGKKTLKLDLICSSLEKYNSNEKFDVITLNHVLEHIKNPTEFLTKIHSLLRPGGYFLLACPNIRSLMFWIFRKRWYGLQPDQHRWQFTPETLAKLVVKHGFLIDKIVVNNLDYQPSGWKKPVFWLLLSLADLTNLGDQVVILAKKK